MAKDAKSKGLVRPRGHGDVVEGLVGASRAGTLPHALLLTGREGIGKFRAAHWLAATLLCERGGEEPCMECGSCLRVQSGSHADVFIVDHRAEAQNSITVHFVATRDPRPKDAYQGPSIDSFLALRSAEGRGKFVIVREAEAMTEEAQNAFLKTLEEPRPGVHLLLECSSPAALLATVRSRVVVVRLEPPGPDDCREVLREVGSFDEGDDATIETLARLSGGAPGLALRFHARCVPEIEELLAAAFCGDRSRAEVAAELFDLDGDFPGKTASAQRRTRARTILDVGLGVLTDVERSAAGASEDTLTHGRAASRVAASSFGRSKALRRRAGEGWLLAREDLNLNLAPEALVDRALSTVERP